MQTIKRKIASLRTSISVLVLFSCLQFNIISNMASAAGFSTNFSTTAFSTVAKFDEGSGYLPFGTYGSGQAKGNGDPTAFAMQIDTINGTYYFHTIVGDPATGFAQESYTRYKAGPGSSDPCCGIVEANSPDSGGQETHYTGIDPIGQEPTYIQHYGNLGNPLAPEVVSGNGTQDPSKTVFHMVLTSSAGDMSLDVFKPYLDKKPQISQTVQDGTMSSVFVADMRSVGYSDMNKPISIINNIVLQDSSIPGNGAANFDMSLTQHSEVTAGRYTFTKPVNFGWNDPDQSWYAADSIFVHGSYSYFDGSSGFDVFNADWTSFFNYDQNALACVNPGDGGTRNNMGQIGVDNNGNITLGVDLGTQSCPGHP